MGFFHDLKLKNRFATRLGAYIRAQEAGMTPEQARKYANELYPPTEEDLEYENRLRSKEELRSRRGA
jgi:hypothetical protein